VVRFRAAEEPEIRLTLLSGTVGKKFIKKKRREKVGFPGAFSILDIPPLLRDEMSI
jgi:hypothetical protein